MADVKFEIYQLNGCASNHLYRFASVRELDNMKLEVEADRYDFVYVGKIEFDRPFDFLLEEIFRQFNLNRPDDFYGHSLSVSDVVVLEHNGDRTAYFVDSFGFKKLQNIEFCKGAV